MSALKAFGNWLVSSHKAADNPFRFLRKMSAEVDVRKNRRPLTLDEFTRLVVATYAGPSFRGLSGADRVELYVVAAFTGLRASELASLTPESFHQDATTPTVVVEAAYSKHRRRDEVPLHPAIVTRLRPWLAGKAGPLWPGKWASQFSAAKMLRCDLTAAGIAPRDPDGKTIDFHSLRHTFITNLVKSGVQPKDAMHLARHSTITLTMDRYSHVTLTDTAAAVARLSEPLALPLAQTADNGGGQGSAIEESGDQKQNPPIVRLALEMKAIESDRGVLRSGEGGKRDRTVCKVLLIRDLCFRSLRDKELRFIWNSLLKTGTHADSSGNGTEFSQIFHKKRYERPSIASP